MLELHTNTFKIKYHLASDIFMSVKQAGDYSKFHQALKPVVVKVRDIIKDEDPCFASVITEEVFKGVLYASMSFAEAVYDDEDPENWEWSHYELYYNSKFEIKLFERCGDSLYIDRADLKNKQYPMDTVFKLYNISAEEGEGLPYITQPMQDKIKKLIREKLEHHRINYGSWKVYKHYGDIMQSFKPASELIHTALQVEGLTANYSVRVYGDKNQMSNQLVNAVYLCFAREWTNTNSISVSRERVNKSYGEECTMRAYHLSMMDYANITAQLFMMKVLNERILTFKSKEGKLVLMDIETKKFYSFYSDICGMEPEDIRDAVYTHLDYLNEHPWMDETISDESFKVLKECAEILNF